VNRMLSTYLGQWARQATDACEAANVRGELSREELALRTTCLDERLSEARAVSDLLMRADARVVTHAVEAALGLPDLDRCSNLVLLRAVRPPETAEKQAAVARLRQRMAEVKLLAEIGHFESIPAGLDTLERDVRAVSYPPLLVDFLLLAQWNLKNTGVPSKGVAVTREALRVAETAGYEEGIAQALMGLATAAYRDPAVADLVQEQADAVLHHLGDPFLLRAWLENDVSVNLSMRGQLAEALAHAQRALALKEQRTPLDARDVAITESNICWVLAARGQAKEGLPHCDRAVELDVSALGPNHPQSMNSMENRAAALTVLGRFDEGCPLADRVRAYFEAKGERIDERSTLLLALGRCAVSRGRPDVGRDLLERALAEAKRTGATTVETADIEWPLARTVDAAGDRRRGIELAERAAGRYATLPELAFRVREIRAWLADRRDRNR